MKHSEEERQALLERDSDLRSLHDALDQIDNVIVEPTGEGRSWFKVRILGRENKRFMSLCEPYDTSYVCWGSQLGKAKEICRRLWAPHVKNPKPEKDDGSHLKCGVSVETIIQVVHQCVAHCRPTKDRESGRPDRVESNTFRICRDIALAQRIKETHKHKCQIQICKWKIDLPDGSRYAEAHHIKPLGEPHCGPDIAANIIVLCPNHHVMCDYGVIRLDRADLRLHEDHPICSEFIDYHNDKIHGPLNVGKTC